MKVKNKNSHKINTASPHGNSHGSSSGKKKLLWAIAAIPLLLVALIVWGLIEPYILDNEEEEAIIPNLPAAWEGKKIGQVSDFQVGMWWDNTYTVAKSVEKLIEEDSDAVFITGDFIYHANPNPQPEIDKVVDLLRPLTEANIPTYAVLGNHDYGMKSKKSKPDNKLATQLEQGLESIGIDVLNNEAVAMPLQGKESNLHVVGVDSHWAKRDRIDEALSQLSTDTPRIVMVHNPDSFLDFPANTAPLAIAGHTHGGQIRLPYLPQWSWLSFAKDDKVVSDGWIDKKYGNAGNKLYVNRGIGFSDIPIRINCAPEITFFTLKSQAK